MTFGEMQTEFEQAIDKSGSGWFTPIEEDLILNQAQDEYTDLCYANFERDEKMREELAPVTIGPLTFSTTDTINLSAITDFKYTLSVSSRANSTDVFGTTTVIESSVQPRSLDQYMKNKYNSFTKATPDNPVYQQYFASSQKQMKIDVGGGTPLSVTLLYMRIPTVIDGANNPSSVADFSDAVCRKIIQIAARKALGILENKERVETQQLEIQNSQTIN